MKSFPVSVLLVIALCVTALSLGYIVFNASDSSPLSFVSSTQTAQVSSTKYTLQVYKVDANGTLSDPNDVNKNYGRVFQTGIINCGSICSNQVSGGGAVELYEAADTGYTFTRWSTGPCTGTSANPCRFAMPVGGATVTALFTKNGTTPPVTPPADTTAPTISSVSVPASTLTTTGATISWTTNEAADTQVEYGLTSAVPYSSMSVLNTTLSTSHSVTLSGLTAGTVYHYRVTSKDAAGNKAVSSDMTFTTVTPPISSTNYLLKVTKTDSNGTDYKTSGINYGRVFQSGIVNCGSLCDNYNVFGNSAVELYVEADAGYTFTRWSTGPCAGQATIPCRFSMPGATTLVTALFTKNGVPADVIAPSVPTNPVASAVSSSQISLKWIASVSTDVTGYRVYRNGTQVGTSATLSYTDGGLTASTPYSYKVAAVDAAGNLSAQSAAASATTLPASDTTAPVVSAFSVGLSTPVTLTVSTAVTATDNIGVTGYLVNESATKPSATAAGWTSSAPIRYTFATAGAKILYAWAKDAADNVSLARSATVTVNPTNTDTTAPSIPTGLTATTISSSQINLAWNANAAADGVTGYQVFRSTAQGVVGDQIANVTVPTQITFQNIAGLTGGVTYWYSITAYDGAGNFSGRSTPQVSATTRASADTTVPVVGTFTVAQSVPASLTVVTSFTATDNVGVTGYLVNESSAAPLATAQGWTTTAPTTYTFTTAGAKILYAWARDLTGNVSLSKAASITVTGIVTPPPTGTVRYIREGGTGNGADWNSAFGNIPADLTRGYTYYMADGTYATGGYNFNDAASTTAPLITIKKATVADHGTALGWSDTYGDGTAIFNGGIKITTPYYTFDGMTRGADWRSGYGIKINTNGQPKGVDFYNGGSSAASNVTFSNVEIAGNGLDNTIHDDGVYAPWQTHFVTLSKVYIHDVGRTALLTGFNKNWTLEYSVVARNSNDPVTHAEGWSGTGDSNFVIRFNRFEDIEGTGFLVWLNRGAGANINANFEIYGNTFMYSPGNPYGRDGVGDGAIAVINEQVAQNWKIYNNSFINLNDGVGISARIEIGANGTGNSNVQVYNNYWWKGIDARHTMNSCTGCSVSNNRYDQVSSTAGEVGAQVVSTANTGSFVNYAGKDFRLSAPTAAGLSLAAPYNVDMNGVTRGTDGAWDRGAYEYTGTTPPPDTTAPAAPTNLVAPTISTTQINLSWTASVSGDVIGYKVSRPGIQPQTVTGTTYADTGLSAGTTYSYTVVAFDAAGNTSSPASGSFTTSSVSNPLSTTFNVTDKSKVVVTGLFGSYLNVRSSPSNIVDTNIISTAGTIIDGIKGTVTTPPAGYTNGVFADTYYWWYVNFGSVTGWASQTYLALDTTVPNTPPTVSIATPTVSGTAPATVSLSATAADSDGTVSSVSFYNGSTLIGTDTSSPYTFSWTGVAAGTYSAITARATDNSSAVTTSITTSVTVAAGPSIPPGTAGNTCTGTCYYVTPTGSGNNSGSNWDNAMRGLTNLAPNADWLSNNVTLVGGATYYLAGGAYQPSAYSFRAHSGGMTYVVKATVENSGLVKGWTSSYASQAKLGALLIFGDNYSFDGVYRNETKWDDAASYGFSASWTKVDSRPLSTAANPVGPTGNHISFKYFSIGTNDVGPNGWSGYPGHGFEYYKQSGTPLTDYYMGYSYLHTFSDVPIRFNNTTGAVIEYNFIGPSYTKEALRGDAGVSNITIRHNIFQNNCQDIPDQFDPERGANGCTAEIGPWDQGYYDNWKIYGNVFKDTISIPHGDAVIFGGTYSQGDPGHKARNWEVYNNVFTGMTGGGAFTRINIDGTNNSVHDNFWYNNGPASGVTCDEWGKTTTCTNNKIVTSVTEAYANILPVISAQVR